jgi:hypothetical protein
VRDGNLPVYLERAHGAVAAPGNGRRVSFSGMGNPGPRDQVSAIYPLRAWAGKATIGARKAELKARALESKEEEELVEVLEAWINRQRWSFLTDVNLGSWSGISTRKMAEEAGCLDFYNYVYAPFSACTHSMCGITSEYITSRSAETLSINSTNRAHDRCTH